MSDTSAILRFLADVAAGAERPSLAAVTRRRDLVSLGWLSLLHAARVPGLAPPQVRITSELRDLIRLDRLHREEQLLRLGWLWVTGPVTRNGETKPALLPLVTTPVELRTIVPFVTVAVWALDDLAVNPVAVPDREHREELDELLGSVVPKLEWMDMNVRLLQRFESFNDLLRRLVAAAGLRHPRLTELDVDPWELRGSNVVQLAPGTAVYLARNVDGTSVADDLRNWAGRDTSRTALASLYLGADDPGQDGGPIESPFPLNDAQRAALQRARTAPITVVSGPPGTGKTHLAAALAVDEVARGNTVLIATQSPHAGDAVQAVLDRYPGPRYIRFGSDEARRDLADDLAGGLAVPYDDAELERLEAKRTEAAEAVDRERMRIRRALQREIDFGAGLAARAALASVAVDTPRAVDPAVDIGRIRALRERLDAGGVLGGWRRRLAARRLGRVLGCGDADRAVLEDGVLLAEAEHAVRRGLEGGGLTLDAAWDRLEAAEGHWRVANGEVVEGIRRRRQNRRKASRDAVIGLTTALRAGRVARRRLLRNLSADRFLDVLPLWLGTLTEIDDTLPLGPGVFDVVILDEASQIDQMRAAPALARARRAVIIGDPRQLRHVSFVSDSRVQEAADEHGVAVLSGTLDVRRNSVFDAAAGGPVVHLDEHFRSVPHLISFSNREFYKGRLRLMTVHPANERADAIDVVTVPGSRDGDGVNAAEVEEVGRIVRGLMTQPAAGSIGVMSPFRAQADALEELLLRDFSAEELERVDLRVGTVHGFQGNERDTVVVSTAISSGEAAASLRFIEDRNLFNVMVTRARRSMILVTSLPEDALPPGLLARYLAHGDRPPSPSSGPRASGPPAPGGWIAALAARLEERRIRVVAAYPVAGYSVDLAVGEGERAIGVECSVARGDPDAHIERHAALRRAGWTMTDAFESRWLADPDAAVEALAMRALAGVGGGPA